MKMFEGKSNNKGFSLIELVVIIAIMALGVGVVSLSVSLVTGAQARKAFEKMESQLDETKTGAMSRFDETLTITYKSKDTAIDVTGSGTGEQDQDGFYAVKKLMTLAAEPDATDATKLTPKSVVLGSEQVFLSDDRVEMTIFYKDGSGAEQSYLLANDGNKLVFSFERATGLYKDVQVLDASDNVVYSGQPVAFEAKSGLKTYRMEFVPETGKHVRKDS